MNFRSYAVGDIFVTMSEDDLNAMLSSRQEGVASEMKIIEGQCAATDAELAALKVKLYAKFGDAINLEK